MNNMSGEISQSTFDQAANDLQQPLRPYFQNCVGNRAVAEDLLQETLLRISNGLPDFAGRSSIRTWAYAIANRVGATTDVRPAASNWLAGRGALSKTAIRRVQRMAAGELCLKTAETRLHFALVWARFG